MTIAGSRGMWGITVDTLALDILMLMLMYTGVNQRNQTRSYLDFDYLVSVGSIPSRVQTPAV